jgi:hypothetical protein
MYFEPLSEFNLILIVGAVDPEIPVMKIAILSFPLMPVIDVLEPDKLVPPEFSKE